VAENPFWVVKSLDFEIRWKKVPFLQIGGRKSQFGGRGEKIRWKKNPTLSYFLFGPILV
jgi:hypothetical protein